MRWSERQRRMLEQIGVRLWPAPAGAPAAPVAARPAAAPQGPRPAMAGEAARPAVVPEAAPTRPPAAVAPRAPPRADAAATGSDGTPAGAAEPIPAIPVLPPAAAPGDDDRTRAIAAMGWPQLRAAVAACRACGLCATRRQTVFGVGHPQAHWMVVGEAPGEQEDLKGEPFVGAAGQLLDAMLHALRLTRAEGPPEGQVYIANTLKCRPPRNRNPEPDELLRCEPFLVRQIELVRPRLILAMGRFAVQALLRSSEPIGRLRGRVHRYHGVPLVVTYHPAYLLRNPADKARAWDDLLLAAATAEAAGAGG